MISLLKSIPGILDVKINRTNELYLTKHGDWRWGELKGQIFLKVAEYFNQSVKDKYLRKNNKA